MGSGSPSPPQPQNPQGVAQQQQQYNTTAGQSSQSGSLINQSNPYGSLNYQQTGVDQFGNPIYASSVNFSPSQQSLYNLLTGNQQTAGTQAGNLLAGANYGGASPTQTIGNETSGIQGQLMGQWLQSQSPWLTLQQQQLDTQLRNQGLDPNNPAYQNQMKQLEQAQTQGVAGAASQFQPQAFSEAQNLYTLPENLALQLGAFGQPTSPNSALVQTPQLSIAPADLEGAVAQAENMQMQAYQQQMQNQASFYNALAYLGGAGLKAAFPGPSDRRIKNIIKQIGSIANVLGIYIFTYKGDDKTPYVGVMAQDLAKVYPEAVHEIDGILHVNRTFSPLKVA